MGVGEDGRWGEEAEPMAPAVVEAEGVGEDGRWGEEAEPVRRPWRHGGGGEKSHRWPDEGRGGRRLVVQRPMVDRRASKSGGVHLVLSPGSLVLIQRRFGGRSGKPVAAAGGGFHLREPEYRGEACI